MSAFLTPLRLEKVGPQRWVVLTDLVFWSAQLKATYVVEAGYATDLASIPRLAQWLLSKVGRYDEAAVLHDAAYSGDLRVEWPGGVRQPVRLIKPLADALFREAAEAQGVKGRTAAALFLAVSWFGRKSEAP